MGYASALKDTTEPARPALRFAGMENYTIWNVTTGILLTETDALQHARFKSTISVSTGIALLLRPALPRLSLRLFLWPRLIRSKVKT